MWYRWPHGQECKTKLEWVIRPVLESTYSHSSIKRFHMTSRRPYWCSKTIKRRPYWCSKQILRELDPFLMLKFFFVLIHLHRWWPTWVKTLYKPVQFSWIFFRKLINVVKKVKHNLKNAKKIKTCRKVADQLVAKPNRDQRVFLFPPLTSLRQNEAFANFKSK